MAELYPSPLQKRFFVYPRETLLNEPIFPFYVLDGGAFFFMTDNWVRTLELLSSWLERLTWTHTGKDFCVHTLITVASGPA
ncbi:MAG: hypothetical protein VB070_03805 [Clostridiaceae bacterium]|nr:hypothetical protein [Clostridiaceae bacterium]